MGNCRKVFVVFALLACAARAAPRLAPDVVEQEIRTQIGAWQAAAARRDATALAALYAEDATIHYPGLREVRGRTAIEGLWRGIFSMATVTIVPGRIELSPAGDVAIEYGTYEVRSLTGAVTDRGRYAFVWRRTGTAWLGWLDITTSDARPVPPA